MGDEIKLSYESLWKFIIRPPRDDYTESMLGRNYFKYKGKKYHRKDYEIMSTQGYMMKCSFIEPVKEYRPSIEMPVVLYLHGNSSSRIEGLNMAGELLKRNINLFVIDFAGCGMSEGEYISLGYHESHDVGNIINFLEKLPGVGAIGIWGRSMGAATAMIYAHRDPRVKAICLDSPFADFNRLAKELTLKQISLPGFLISGILTFVRSTILKKNGLDIDKLKPIDVAEKTFQPVIFVHAIYDELIDIQHSKDLCDRYGGQEKSLKCCDKGGHNTNRNSMIINEIGSFFTKHLYPNNNFNIQINDNKNIPNNNIIINNDNNKNYNFEKEEQMKKLSPKLRPEKKNSKMDLRKMNSIEEEEDLFNNKTIEKIEYFKKKEETEIKEKNKFEFLLKSIREPDITKAFNQEIKNDNKDNNQIHNNKNNNNNYNNKNSNNINDKNKNKNVKSSSAYFNNWKNGGKINKIENNNNFQFQ